MTTTWTYKTTHATIKGYLEQIYDHLVPTQNQTEIPFPHFGIDTLGRSYLCKHFHTYTDDGQMGSIVLNSMYIKPNPSDNEIIYYIVLAVDALCQHVVMCKNEGKKLMPHCSQVKALLKQTGLVYNGTKAHLSFTKEKNGTIDSLLYATLEADYNDEIDHIVYAETLPPKSRKAKAQPIPPVAQNQMNFDVPVIPENLIEEYARMKQTLAESQKTLAESQKKVQELTQQLAVFKAPLQPLEDQVQELAHATTTQV